MPKISKIYKYKKYLQCKNTRNFYNVQVQKIAAIYKYKKYLQCTNTKKYLLHAYTKRIYN